mmetsp:Transcript_3198/g.11161  ORF Transcript_3198/g.11161 Transcript_3198/m.11161 type:complete len:406 (+) Transcript_3198:1042-2259(+)
MSSLVRTVSLGRCMGKPERWHSLMTSSLRLRWNLVALYSVELDKDLRLPLLFFRSEVGGCILFLASLFLAVGSSFPLAGEPPPLGAATFSPHVIRHSGDVHGASIECRRSFSTFSSPLGLVFTSFTAFPSELSAVALRAFLSSARASSLPEMLPSPLASLSVFFPAFFSVFVSVSLSFFSSSSTLAEVPSPLPAPLFFLQLAPSSSEPVLSFSSSFLPPLSLFLSFFSAVSLSRSAAALPIEPAESDLLLESPCCFLSCPFSAAAAAAASSAAAISSSSSFPVVRRPAAVAGSEECFFTSLAVEPALPFTSLFSTSWLNHFGPLAVDFSSMARRSIRLTLSDSRAPKFCEMNSSIATGSSMGFWLRSSFLSRAEKRQRASLKPPSMLTSWLRERIKVSREVASFL